MKRKYEIVYIFDSALEEPEVNQHLDRFHALLKSSDQSDPITGLAHWGKRTLAYPIKKKEVGYYVVAHVETETGLLSEFERVVKLNESVLRYLVVINEGLPATRPDHSDSEGTNAEADDSRDARKGAAEAPATKKIHEARPEAEESEISTDEGDE